MCKRINIFFPCLLFFYIFASLAVSFILASTGTELPFWVQCVISQAILLTPALLYVLVMRIHIFKYMPYRRLKPLDALLSLLFGYALVPAVLFLSNLSTLFSANHLQESTSDITSYPFLVQILLIAVLPPLVEEFLFRGLFYHSYRKNGILGAAFMSGLVFGAFHLNINQFCYAFFMGVVFALMVEATGSMFSSMIAHFAVNTYSITMLKLISLVQPSEELLEEAQQAQGLADYPVPMILMTLLSLAVFAASFLALAYVFFYLMAKRSGRWEYIRTNLKKGVKAQNGEHFMTIPAAVTLIAAFAYMIMIEVL